MKYAILLSLFLILTACTQYSTIDSEQSVVETEGIQEIEKAETVQTSETKETIDKKEAEVSEAEKQEITESNEEKEELKPRLIDAGNMTFSSQEENDLYLVKGIQHTIEVVDVTEDQEGCLVRIDGITDLIKLDETKTINGVKVTVLDVYAMKSQLEDNDVCQLIVR